MIIFCKIESNFIFDDLESRNSNNVLVDHLANNSMVDDLSSSNNRNARNNNNNTRHSIVIYVTNRKYLK